MTPAEFRALLDKATPRLWRVCSRVVGLIYSAPVGRDFIVAETPDDADAFAIVATMNRADLLAELWEAVRAFDAKGAVGFYFEKHSDVPHSAPTWHRVRAVLAELEES